MDSAYRGQIYEFKESDGSFQGNYVLVVSDDSRKLDKFVSIIMLYRKPFGTDIVEIRCRGIKMYLRCGMVTYTCRDRLGDLIGTVSAEEMDEVNNTLCRQLGICDVDYKKLYEDLLQKVTEERRKGNSYDTKY